jgi:hypothetical protein
MTRNRIVSLLFLAACVSCVAANPARTQPAGASAAASSPDEKVTKARFEVLHMMRTAIQVRSLSDQREIHTFTYSDQIRTEMQSLFDQGGYRYGDQVEIYFKVGSDVALKIKGKPSK